MEKGKQKGVIFYSSSSQRLNLCNILETLTHFAARYSQCLSFLMDRAWQ